MTHRPPDATQSASWPRAATVALVAGWLVLLVEAAVVGFYADTIYDEGGYLYEGWLVCARRWRPYRDFHTKVTPLLYYFYGFPQAVIGPSIAVGRIQAAATTMAALAIGSWAIARRRGLWAAAAAVWLFAATVAGLDQHFRALAVAPCALWAAVALLGVAYADRRWGPWLAGAGVGLLLLTRHDMAGMAAGLLAGAWMAGGTAALARAVGGAVGVFLVGIAPFVAAAPRTVLRVLSMEKLFPPPECGPRPFARTQPITMQNLPWYLKFLIRAYMPPLTALTAPLMARLTGAVRGPLADPVAAAALLAAAANLAVRGGAAAAMGKNAFYLRDFYIELPLILGVASVAAAAWTRATDAAARKAVVLALGAAVVLAPLVFGPPATLRPSRPTVLESIAAAGRFIARHTTDEDRIFTIADPHAFLAAGRQLLPLLTHHMFMYAPAATADQLRGTWFFNLPMLIDMMRRRATVVVLTARGMRWLVHNDRTTAGIAVDRAVRRELEERWRLVAAADNAFFGRIEIYRPKP